MNFHNIRLIFLREVRDQLRDRRTLFMVAVLPLLLYPALGIGMFQMTLLFTEQPRTVVILGEKHLPPPPLLDGESFAGQWFHNPADAAKLKVVTDASVETGGVHAGDVKSIELIEHAKKLRPLVDERGRKDAEVKRLIESLRSRVPTPASSEPSESKEQSESSGVVKKSVEQPSADQAIQLAKLKSELAGIDAELSAQFVGSPMQVLIVVPDGLKEDIERVNRLLAEKRTTADANLSYARPTIVKNRADDKSVVAFSRVQDVFELWEHEILRQRLSLAGLPEGLPKPINPELLDIAAEDQLSANVWSKLFPAMLVIMAVTGAFYPAVDLAAGEKERGTMETLLICPATRAEIVVGKFLTVMCFSISTALLNLVSIGATGNYMLSAAGGQAGAGGQSMSKLGEVALPGFGSLVWVFVLLIPLAALFSALCLALATFARSSKEGQYYLTPLLMISIGLTVFCMSPAVEIFPIQPNSWFYSVMPVVGITLLLKAVLLNPGNPEPLILAGPVLITSIGYSLIALWWAIEQFSREEVLFREGERFELRLWLKQLFREKEPTPNFTEAMFCFVLIMLSQFISMRAFGQSIASAAPDQIGTAMMKLLVIQQLAIIAAPALFMGLILTTSVRRTFKLFFPDWRYLAIATALPFVLHPLSLELMASLDWFFPHLPEGAGRLLKMLSDHTQPIWLVVLAFAIAPGICEELAFRGFILTGLQRSGRSKLPIALSALLFGVMHLIPQQVFNASLLGLVLGLIAVRSNSLLPGIIFHAIYNSLAVVRERTGIAFAADRTSFDNSLLPHFFRLEEASLRYTWLTLLICGVVAYTAICWLIRSDREHVS